jgi:hypothetical protein
MGMGIQIPELEERITPSETLRISMAEPEK